MSEYTKGPWFVGEPDKNGQAIIRNADIEIATCWHHCVGAIEKEMHGNARIMAASLDLYKALQALRSFMWAEGYADQTAAMAQADAAIRKAEDL